PYSGHSRASSGLGRPYGTEILAWRDRLLSLKRRTGRGFDKYASLARRHPSWLLMFVFGRVLAARSLVDAAGENRMRAGLGNLVPGGGCRSSGAANATRRGLWRAKAPPRDPAPHPGVHFLHKFFRELRHPGP